jgi:3'(2'), 5'-bisphosphate nucleotidase
MTTRASRAPATLPEFVHRAAGPLSGDLAVAAAAALAGGVAALAHYGPGLAVEDGGRGPVTAADRASHEAIGGTLRELRPGEPVRSEEGGSGTAAGADGRLWVVDPLDGTREFIAGIPEFSVMVGLAVEGRAVLGAVYQPAADRLFLGVAGAGAWAVEGAASGSPARWEARPLSVGRSAPRVLRVVESRSHPDEALTRLAGRLAGRFDVRTVRSGSAGTKCALVAAGEADLYVHPVPHLREWDTCAGAAVASGAGARVSDARGAPLEYGKADPAHPGGIFVAPPAVWERVADDVAAVAPGAGNGGAPTMATP